MRLVDLSCSVRLAASTGLLLLAGCSSSSNAPPVVSDLQAPRADTSPAPIRFVVTDVEENPTDVALGYRVPPSQSFRPITLAAGSPGLTQIPSSPTPYEVLWDFAADLGDESFVDGIELQLTLPSDPNGIAPPILTDVSEGNDAPSILIAEPLPTNLSEYSGNTDITFIAADSSSDTIKVKVEYNDDGAGGFPEGAWKLARPAGVPASESTPAYAFTNFSVSPSGVSGTFRWDTAVDLAGTDALVRVRFTPEDPYISGAPFSTGDFAVDNNTTPLAILDGQALALGIKDRGNIPIPFELFDQESDDLAVLVQWRALGQAFPVLPTSPADLIDLLENPDRADERRQLQVATEAPPSFGGRVGSLAGLAANEIRLPQLADSALGLLGHGIANRTLEIWRPTRTPVVQAWAPNPLDNPVATVAMAGGSSAAVLESAGASWNLRELDLTTGAEIRQIATGSGSPRALTTDASGAQLFVGSSTGLFRVDRELGTVTGTASHSFTDGPRALAALGTDIVLATGDSQLVRFDVSDGSTATVLAGLSEPWGIATDPIQANHIYLAERTLNRVSTLDLDSGRPRTLAAQVAPADVATLGANPFPSPRALALEQRGARLLVMTEFGGSASLRSLNLRSPTDYDQPADGQADPFVREVTQFTEPGATVSTGPDGLRIVSLSATDEIAVGGGISQRIAIVPNRTAATDPEPYVAATQVVALTADLSPVPPAGTPWRIRAPMNGASSPTGQDHVFVWDTNEVPDPDQVQVQILPIDGDIGATSVSSTFQPFRSNFDSSTNLATGVGPESVHAADLDGDGDLDLVWADEFNNTLTIAFQTSPGVFALDPPLATGGGPSAVLVADLDGDQDLDLASTNSGSDTLSVFFQTAPGVFSNSGTTPLTGPSPSAIAGADLDEDGDIDLAVANRLGNSVTLFFQNPAGVFTPDLPTLTTASNPSSVAAADLDFDGDLDLVASNRGSDSMTLFFQIAPGAFSADPTPLTTGSTPRAVLPGELDGDGRVDLTAVNGGSDSLTVFEPTSPGVYVAQPTPIATGNEPESVQQADLDNDGDWDLVTANRLGDSLSLLFQTTPGNFTTSAAPLSSGAGAGSAPQSVAAADLNGNGYTDLIAANTGDNTLTLFQQTTAGDFTPGTDSLSSTVQPTSVVSTDLDGDGDADLVAANFNSNSLRLFFQIAPGVLAPAASVLVTGTDPNSVVAADLDGNGTVDLATADQADDSVTLFFQTLPGQFAADPVPLTTGSNPSQIAAADLDNDGDLDLVTANAGSDNLTLFYQSSPGVFVPGPSALATSGAPRGVVAADLDGDGDIDLAAADSSGNRLTLFFQDSNGTFLVAPGVLNTGTGPVAVAAADLDGDGDLDLVSANSTSDDLTLFFQDPAGTFTAAASTLPAGTSPSAVTASDLDGDGDIDLVVANSGSDDLTLCFQHAPGIFTSSPTTLPTGIRPQAVAVADIDSDGDADLVSADSNSDRLTLFFNGR